MRIAGAGRVPDKPVVIVCSCVICAFRLVCHEPVCEYITGREPHADSSGDRHLRSRVSACYHHLNLIRVKMQIKTH